MPPVTRVRSTLITASLHALRAMGWEDAYFGHLPADRHDTVRGMVAGSWLAVDVALDHYRACDALKLSANDIRALGERVSMRTQQAFVGTILRVAAGAGATPWHLYKNAHRIWERMIDGADQCVSQIGPKEAVVNIVGCVLLEIPYFRDATVAYYRAAAANLSRAVYVREERSKGLRSSIEMRISWA